MDVDGVYRIDPTLTASGKESVRVTRVLTQKEIDRPNGIAISPDDKTLYVIDSLPKLGGNRKIWAFDVAKDGSLSKRRLVYDSQRPRRRRREARYERQPLVAAGISSSAAPAKRSTTRRAFTSSRPTASCSAAFRFRKPDHQRGVRRPGAQDAVRDRGKTVYRISTTVSGYALYPPLAK